MLRNAVTRARLRGYDWGRIARLLGRSRQGVRQRFGAVAPLRQSPTVLREAASTAEFDRIDQLKADVHRNYLWSTETDMVPW